MWQEQASGPIANVGRGLAGESFLTEMAFQGGYYLTTYEPHRTDDGRVQGVLVFSRDITELHASRLALVQTEKIRHFPILLYGSDYWQGLVEWLHFLIQKLVC